MGPYLRKSVKIGLISAVTVPVLAFVAWVLLVLDAGYVWKTGLLALTAVAVYAGVRFIRYARAFSGVMYPSENVASRDPEGRTPLHRAAVLGHVDVARVLMVNGADVNARDEYGATPLWYAVGDHQLPMARLLLEAGAEVDQETIRLARELSNSVMTELLYDRRRHGSDASQPTA